jgi:thioredoxin reductase
MLGRAPTLNLRLSGATGARKVKKRMVSTNVAIIGAGPYGLACAAHLRRADVDTHVFGRTMEFWENRMPEGMWLRSSWEASTISDPDGRLSLDVYDAGRAEPLARPVRLEDFIAYGRWFAQQAVPEVDERRVDQVERDDAGFRLRLADGDVLTAARVILATGLEGFEHRPAALAHLPRGLVPHSVDIRELRPFAGRRVVVLGSGQSAIELGALLHEARAEVDVIARASQVRWLVRSGWLHRRPPRLRHLLYPPTDVGPPILNQLVAKPHAFRTLPSTLQGRIAYRSIRPAAAGWLVDRVRAVPVHLDTRIERAAARDGTLLLELSDGGSLSVERLVLATGYRPDIARHPLLGADLVSQISHDRGYPRLGRGFETSVPGLHVVGALSAYAFGPVMRFVSGTWFTAGEIASQIAAVGGPRRRFVRRGIAGAQVTSSRRG